MRHVLIFLKKILKKKIYIKIPKKSALILYGNETQELFIKSKYKDKYIVIDKNKFNLYILFLCFIKLEFKNEDYYKNYIKILDPKLIVTIFDNDSLFYRLKKNFLKKIFISVQNGYRFPSEISFFKDLQKFKKVNAVDYYFVFNKNYGKLIKKYIKCKTIVHGSFRSNNVKILKKEKKNDFLFISQYSINKEFNSSYIKEVKKIFLFLNKFCKNKRKKLLVLMKHVKNSKGYHEEKNFYKSLILFKFKFFEKKNSSTRAIYTFLDNAKLVLGIDSTASYEALARKNKSIMFHNRRIKNKNISIGWPQRKKKYNLIVPKSLNAVYLKKFFDNALSISDEKWHSNQSYAVKELIEYNKKNKMFFKYVDNILKN